MAGPPMASRAAVAREAVGVPQVLEGVALWRERSWGGLTHGQVGIHAFPSEYSDKGPTLAQLLGQLGVFLNRASSIYTAGFTLYMVTIIEIYSVKLTCVPSWCSPNGRGSPPACTVSAGSRR